jgi:hypothetical protein
MPKLYSYVVDHDHGFAPNPFGGFCTLVKCKYGSKKCNIVEMAEEEDWIAGTGGVKAESAGHGKLIYAMRVDEKIPLADYCPRSSRAPATVPTSRSRRTGDSCTGPIAGTTASRPTGSGRTGGCRWSPSKRVWEKGRRTWRSRRTGNGFCARTCRGTTWRCSRSTRKPAD